MGRSRPPIGHRPLKARKTPKLLCMKDAQAGAGQLSSTPNFAPTVRRSPAPLLLICGFRFGAWSSSPLASWLLRSLGQLFPTTGAWQQHWNLAHISAILVAKFTDHAAFFLAGEKIVGEHDHREQNGRKDCRPVNAAFSEQSKKQPGILRVPYETI